MAMFAELMRPWEVTDAELAKRAANRLKRQAADPTLTAAELAIRQCVLGEVAKLNGARLSVYVAEYEAYCAAVDNWPTGHIQPPKPPMQVGVFFGESEWPQLVITAIPVCAARPEFPGARSSAITRPCCGMR